MTDSHSSVREELLGLPDRRLMRHAIDTAREQLAGGGDAVGGAARSRSRGWRPAASSRRPSSPRGSAAALHPDDLVGCFGGDVLVVVARDIPDDGAAHALAARLAER